MNMSFWTPVSANNHSERSRDALYKTNHQNANSLVLGRLPKEFGDCPLKAVHLVLLKSTICF